MCVHKIAMAAAFCTFGLFAAGAGSWPPASPARQFAADKPEVQANPGLAKDREQPRPGERARQIRRQLAQYVSVEAIEANTPLETAVRSLSKKFKIPLEIDGKAFQAVGLQKAEESPVELPKMTDVRLATVLRRLMRQVKGDVYTGTYIVRPDCVELTSMYHQWLEAGADPVAPSGTDLDGNEPIVPRELGYLGPLRRPTMVVHVEYDRLPLVEALRDLADDSGYDVVIDPRVAEKARTPITLGLNVVWLDNAVSLMTELAELDWYWMDRVVYVTSRENAKQRKDKLKARIDGLPRPTPPPATGTQAAANGTITINCKEQPLGEVLRGLAGVQIVIDERVAANAKTAVTAKLDQVPPAAAIRILADMADLGVVALEGVFYVTSKENARTMKP